MSGKHIIVWDVDDVLNCLMESWLEHWNQEHDSNIALVDINNNPPHDIMGVSKDVYFSSLDEFRNSEAGKNVHENPVVKSWFKINGEKFNHMACTARPIQTMPNQAWWVYGHYGEWIYSIHAADAGRNGMQNVHGVSKAEYISWIDRPVLFVDDSEENIRAVAQTGADTLLYPQPWNGADASEQEFLEELNTRLGI